MNKKACAARACRYVDIGILYSTDKTALQKESQGWIIK